MRIRAAQHSGHFTNVILGPDTQLWVFWLMDEGIAVGCNNRPSMNQSNRGHEKGKVWIQVLSKTSNLLREHQATAPDIYSQTAV